MNLPDAVTDTFTATCVTCGASTRTVAGVTEPHRCRIDCDALAGR